METKLSVEAGSRAIGTTVPASEETSSKDQDRDCSSLKKIIRGSKRNC